VVKAVFILGQYRAIEAIPVLTDNIGLEDVPEKWGEALIISPGDRRGHNWEAKPLETWPTVHALVTIGEPCIPAVLKRLGTANTGYASAACVRVLLELKGREEAMAMLRKAIAAEKDPEKSKWLKHGLDRFSTPPMRPASNETQIDTIEEFPRSRNED
jgi:hypothetical protein